MRNKSILVLVAVVTAMGAAGIGAANEKPAMKIYLPATLRVQCSQLDLGTLAVIRGDDEALVKKASAVAMGRAPLAKEQMTIDRATIQSRLATSGIAAGQVEFTGAEKVVIDRDEKVVASKQLLKAAEDYLQEQRPGPAGCLWKLTGSVKDLPVPSTKDFKIQVDAAKDSPKDTVRLNIAVVSGKDELGKTVADYRIAYAAQQAVASADIPAGTAFSKDNIKIETVPCDTKPADGWAPPYGMIATKKIAAGTIISGKEQLPPKPDVLVKRGQKVTMRISGTGFTVTAVGEAQEDGRAGDVIKVVNVDSKRTVFARVGFDGAVEPGLDAKK